MLTENGSTILSSHEQLVLKCIFDLGKADETGVPMQDIIAYLGNKYGKEYARTTVATFVDRMKKKGFVYTYKKERLAYIAPLVTEKEYIEEYLKDQCDFLFDGNVAKMMKSLLSKDTPKEQRDKIRMLLNEMESAI